MGYKMYHNGETFCCVHDHGDTYFAIYNAKYPHDDDQTKYKSIIKPSYAAKDIYLKDFLNKNGYKQIDWEGATK